MKTTIDIPDALYTTLAAASSAEGLSVADFVLRAATERVTVCVPKVESAGARVDSSDDLQLPDSHPLASYYAWFNSRTEAEQHEIREASREVQAIVDEEFSKIDPRDWE